MWEQCSLTQSFSSSPTLPRHLCQNTSQQLWVFQQTRIRLSVFSVKLMHHKQLSFLPALSFIHKAFPSAIPPFAPCLFQTSIACAFSHTQLKVWNGQLHLKPFSCCFKPIYLTVGVYERKMGLTGAWIKLFNSNRRHEMALLYFETKPSGGNQECKSW